MDLDEAISLIENKPDLSKRKHPLAECESCPLQKKRSVPTVGPSDAKVAIVSRSPGRYDVRARKPFGGPSGKVLDHLLGLYGYKRDEVLITNVVLCECDGPPDREAIRCCSGRLSSELESADTIIAAGAEAVAELTPSRKLDGARGYEHRRYTASRRTQRVVATNNPAIVLRDDSTFPNLVRDFRIALAPIPKPTLPDVEWTNNVAEGRRWLGKILHQDVPLLSVDIETRGLRADSQLVALGLAASGVKGLSFGSRICEDDYTFRSYIKPLLSRNCRYLYHNGKFDVRNLRWHGVQARVDEDTLLLSWALDERSDEQQVHSLDYLLMNELGWPKYEPPQVKQWKANVSRLERQLKFEELRELPTPDELYPYNALDAAGTSLLYPILQKRAIEDNVYNVYRKFLIPASESLVRVELAGAHFNVGRACDLLEEEVWPRLDEFRAQLQSIVGDGSYNPNSPQQNAVFVYDNWKLVHQLPLKNDRTVDKSVYNEIKNGRFTVGFSQENDRSQIRETAVRWAEVFADFKELDKQRSTYLEGLIPLAMHDGGMLFTGLSLHKTQTGRLASSKPNLQNITRTKEHLPNIRGLFYAPEGYKLVQADYSQAELRTIAAVSGDEKLCDAYVRGLDLHDMAAERFYGKDFTKEQRSNTKNMQFGVAYLQSAQTFQEKHDIPEKEAQEFINWWWKEYTGVRSWVKEIEKEVTTLGEVISPLGYKRRFHLITKENRNGSIREGINFVPQNVAAVLTLWCLIKLCDVLDPEEAQIILTVHDSLLLRVRDDCVDRTSALVVKTMEETPQELLNWELPFTADVNVGTTWGEV